MHDYGGRKSVRKQLVKFLTSFLCLGLAALFTKTLEKPLVLLPLHDTMARASVDGKDDTLSHEQHAAVNYCCTAAQPRGVITCFLFPPVTWHKEQSVSQLTELQ